MTRRPIVFAAGQNAIGPSLYHLLASPAALLRLAQSTFAQLSRCEVGGGVSDAQSQTPRAATSAHNSEFKGNDSTCKQEDLAERI